MGLLSLLFKNPLAFVMLVVPLLYSVIAHEVAHGWVAYLFGDDTAKRYGRLSLNPLSHLDLFGTIALFIVGFGWAKPVPVNYYRLKNFRPALVCVSLAGVVTNIIIATIAMFFLHFVTNHLIAALLSIIAQINIILGAFNLIPIPPLDGSKVLMAFLPPDAQRSLASIEPYGFFILIFLIFSGLLNPVIIFVQRLILSALNLIF